MPSTRHFGLAGRWAARALVTLAFWCAGLVLCVLLALQVYVACSDQFEMPDFVVRGLEQRLGDYGMHASFGRTRFDPSGRVLIQDVRVTLPGFDEPLVTVAALYARLDLWALIQGRFEPIEVRASGGSLRVPAMFSPSGRPDEIIRDLDADLFPHGPELEVGSLDFRLGGLAVSAHGRMHLGNFQAGHGMQRRVPAILVQNYGKVTRQFAAAISQLGALDHPILEVELTPSESQGAIVDATLFATGLTLPAPVGLQATGLRLTTEFPLLAAAPQPFEVVARAGTVGVPRFGLAAREVHARLRAQWPPARLADVNFLDLTADALTAQGLEIRTPSVALAAGPWPKVHAEFRGRPLDAPLAIRADVDAGAQTAAVRFDGEIAPGLVDFLSGRLHHGDLRRFASPNQPVALSGAANFGPGWAKFRQADVRFAARDLSTWQQVRIDAVSGRVQFDGRRLAASDLAVRFGDNFAQGSYEMDVTTLRYRFLLAGRLRPLEISAWFPHQPWWANLFGHFQFPVAPPSANMEWAGRWPTDHETNLFLSVDAPGIAIGGVPFDRVFGRLFVRPSFDDALEFTLARDGGAAAGTFARWYDQAAEKMTRLDLDLHSTLALGPLAKIWPQDPKDPKGTKAPEVLTLFAFDRPPSLRLAGRFDRPDAAGPMHWTLHLDGQTDGGFRLHGFPLDRARFTAEIHDENFVLDPFTLGFADGTAGGHVELTGTGADKRIALTAKLTDAKLARAIELVQGYSAKGPPAKPAVAGEFLKNLTGVRLDLAVAADGAYADPLSYRGKGTALVQGPELTKVRILGLLSPLLPFTELRFTTARADFLVNGRLLDFPDITVTGAHSRVDAHGTYAVDRHALNFYATVYPLRESKSLPGQVFSAVLAPLSELTRVRLTGSMDDPHWALAAGPTNFLRNLGVPTSRVPNPPSAAPPTPLARPAAAVSPDAAPVAAPAE